jgi:hypothetical protein
MRWGEAPARGHKVPTSEACKVGAIRNQPPYISDYISSKMWPSRKK